MTPEQVLELFNFDGGCNSPVDKCSSQAKLQSEGVALLWHLLERHGFAYLADEVGMGKTRQAMAVVALQFMTNPKSRVVIVCPGETLQRQWLAEWELFIRDCMRKVEYRLHTEQWLGTAPVRPVFHDRLHSFIESLFLGEDRIHLLRYSSFRRPIGFHKCEKRDAILKKYRECLNHIGIAEAREETIRKIEEAPKEYEEDWRSKLTRQLNTIYVERVRPLVERYPIDLLVFDEAQYLRHIDNQQNRHIRLLFQGHRGTKWLFLSATPLHSGVDDLRSLDHYLCRYHRALDSENTITSVGSNEAICCEYNEQGPLVCTQPTCARINHRLDDGADPVDLMKEFVVRRTRRYVDRRGQGHEYDKTLYRYYKDRPVELLSDPFYALTHALVQKGLVAALDGRGNRFRQGECSSFESLNSSLGKETIDSDGNPHRNEFEHTGEQRVEPEKDTPVDRSLIDSLNDSFNKAMQPVIKREEEAIRLPHAKLTELATDLAQRCLRNGANHKVLVFVRRLDTVDELLELLRSHLQREIDQRIVQWRRWLEKHSDYRKQPLPDNETFWRIVPDLAEEEQSGEDTSEDEAGIWLDLGRAERLPYFAALSRQNGKAGFLWNFSSTLQRKDRTLLCWLRDPEKHDDKLWPMLLDAIGCEKEKYAHLYDKPEQGTDDFWRIATLKYCILQSLRRSDFLTDLYVLHKYVRLPEVTEGLGDKLIALLQQDRLPLDGALGELAENWRIRLRNWCQHFDLIQDKCLRSGHEESPEELYDRIPRLFSGAEFLVLGRSGRIENRLAPIQFKTPSPPNILVCTDILKEGVDMHLFCDEVIHYGVAWTSGDLEQRIGRIDRFGCLYQRRIESYQPNDENPIYPRLAVQFPYLKGTLDEHQVRRVLIDKLNSDQTMDLGKRLDEIGELNIEELLSTPPTPRTVSKVEQAVFFRTDELEAVDLNQLHSIPDEIKTRLAETREIVGQWLDDTRARYHPNLNLLTIELPEQDAGIPMDPVKPGFRYGRWIHTGKDAWRLYRTLLIPLELDVAEIENLFTQFKQDDDGIEAYGVTALPFEGGWHYSRSWRTLAGTFVNPDPFDPQHKRQQEVLVESTDSAWVFLSPIAACDETNDEAKLNDSLNWLSEQNSRRWLGQVILDRGLLWYSMTLHHSIRPSTDTVINFVEHLARTADRLQQLFCAGADPHLRGHPARCTFAGALVPALRPVGSKDHHDESRY